MANCLRCKTFEIIADYSTESYYCQNCGATYLIVDDSGV